MTVKPSEIKDYVIQRKKYVYVALIGAVAGMVWLAVVRVALYNPTITHYHANFQIAVDGKIVPLEGPNFYEEISSCSSTNLDDPKARIHLHDNVAHLVHVHDTATTWGHLFTNLGFTLGNSLIKVGDKTYLDGTGGKVLTFTLNGDEVPTIANRLVGSEDVLLVSYGKKNNAETRKLYEAIPRDAGESNSKPDPSSCSGPSSLDFGDRVKKALNITK